MGHSRPLFLYFVFSIQLTVHIVQYKFCRQLDSNHGPLVLEATALPTEPQPLPKVVWPPRDILNRYQKILLHVPKWSSYTLKLLSLNSEMSIKGFLKTIYWLILPPCPCPCSTLLVGIDKSSFQPHGFHQWPNYTLFHFFSFSVEIFFYSLATTLFFFSKRGINTLKRRRRLLPG